MSRGCPAIGSTTAGIPELLNQNAIFNRKNVKDLIKVLLNMTDPQMRIEQAKNNYNKALHYQREDIYKRRNKIFDMVVEENKLR